MSKTKTFIPILLALGFLLYPKSLQAQDGLPSQPSEIASGIEGAPAAPADTKPAKESRWFTRIGVVGAFYHSSATIATNGQTIPGATAKASNNFTVSFDVGYDITKNIAASVTVGVPPKPHITGQGTVASLGVLGKVRYGPMFLTGYYRFTKVGRVRPYVGGGAAYAIIFKEFDGSVRQLGVHNNWGSLLQGGVEYEVNKKYGPFFDFKEVWLAVDAHGQLGMGSLSRARSSER